MSEAGEMSTAYRISAGKPEGNRPFWRAWDIILKQILEKYICLGVGYSVGQNREFFLIPT
jgi:hypothetical protein